MVVSGRMHDRWYLLRQVRELRESKAGREALGLWVYCWSWCLAQPALDGFIPARELGRVEVPAALLCKVGLWARGDGGYYMLGFADHNPSRAQLDKRRASDTARHAAARALTSPARTKNSEEQASPVEAEPSPPPPQHDPSQNSVELAADSLRTRCGQSPESVLARAPDQDQDQILDPNCTQDAEQDQDLVFERSAIFLPRGGAIAGARAQRNEPSTFAEECPGASQAIGGVMLAEAIAVHLAAQGLRRVDAIAHMADLLWIGDQPAQEAKQVIAGMLADPWVQARLGRCSQPRNIRRNWTRYLDGPEPARGMSPVAPPSAREWPRDPEWLAERGGEGRKP